MLHQLACIVAVMLMAGCAVPRSETLRDTPAPQLPVMNNPAPAPSVVQLVAAQQSPNAGTESLPAPQPTNRADQDSPAAETLGGPAGQPMTVLDAVALAFE